MKYAFVPVIILVFLVLLFGVKQKPSIAQEGLKGTISLSGAWALYPLAVRWAEEFRKIYPDVRIDISAGGAGKGISDALNGMVDIGMVSREIYNEEISKGAYPIAVTKDAVVAVINATNPSVNDIAHKRTKERCRK